MEASDRDVGRLLDAAELGWEMLNRHARGGANGVAHLELEAAIPLEVLRRRLHRAQERYPLLAARIRDDGESLWFVSGPDDVFGRLVALGDEPAEDVVGRCMARYVDTARESPIRIYHRLLNGRTELFIACHHGYADAQSLLKIVAALTRDEGDPEEPAPSSPRALSPSPIVASGGRLGMRDRLRVLWRLFRHALRRTGSLLPPEIPAPLEQRKNLCVNGHQDP